MCLSRFVLVAVRRSNKKLKVGDRIVLRAVSSPSASAASKAFERMHAWAFGYTHLAVGYTGGNMICEAFFRLSFGAF